MKSPGLVLIIWITFHCCAAQSVSTLMGARAAALGYASETLGDEWSVHNNIGGLAEVRKTSVAFAADAHPALEGATRVALAVCLPTRSGTAGLGMFRFGDGVYNEQILSAGYGNRMGLASLGLKLNYIQYQAQGFGTHGVLTLGFGGIAQLTPVFAVGAFIVNINQPSLSRSIHEKVPTQLTVGLSYKGSEKFLLLVSVQKDLDYPPVIKTGMEYKIHPALFLRTGFNLHPSAAFLGFGFQRHRVKIDYALQQNSDLNAGHQISFVYVVRKARG